MAPPTFAAINYRSHFGTLGTGLVPLSGSSPSAFSAPSWYISPDGTWAQVLLFDTNNVALVDQANEQEVGWTPYSLDLSGWDWADVHLACIGAGTNVAQVNLSMFLDYTGQGVSNRFNFQVQAPTSGTGQHFTLANLVTLADATGSSMGTVLERPDIAHPNAPPWFAVGLSATQTSPGTTTLGKTAIMLNLRRMRPR